MNYWYIEGRWKSVKNCSWSPMRVWGGDDQGRRLFFGAPTALFDTYSKAKGLAKREMANDADLQLRVVRAKTQEPN